MRAFLGDVADQNQREIGRLRGADQLERAGAHLGDRTRRAVDRSSHIVWIESMTTTTACGLFQAGDDVADIDRRRELDRGVGHAQPAGTEADLLDRFLAGYVKDAFAGRGQPRGGLQQQGRLADPRIAADQHGRGGHQPAAKHAIQFLDPGRGARRRRDVAGQPDECHTLAGGSLRGSAGPGSDGLGFDGVPFAAGFAAAGPFRRDGAAGLANEAGGGFGQFSPVPNGLRVGDPRVDGSGLSGDIGRVHGTQEADDQRDPRGRTEARYRATDRVAIHSDLSAGAGPARRAFRPSARARISPEWRAPGR